MEILLILVIGCAVGFLSTFLGIGGGAIIVPSLYFGFEGIPPTTVISTSLALIFVNSVINSIKFYRKGQKIDYTLASKIGFFCIIGALAGTLVLQSLPGDLIKKIFGIMLLLISLRLFFKKDYLSEQTKINSSLVLIIISGVVGGFISSITGLGGGAIFVPMFISVLKIPIKKVSVYSNFCMMFATCFGLIPHLLKTVDTVWTTSELLKSYYFGYVSLIILALLFIGSNVTNGLGIKFNSIVEAKMKKKIFATLLLVLSLKILI
jgi:uncharacterized membrane protein YfcA